MALARGALADAVAAAVAETMYGVRGIPHIAALIAGSVGGGGGSGSGKSAGGVRGGGVGGRGSVAAAAPAAVGGPGGGGESILAWVWILTLRMAKTMVARGLLCRFSERKCSQYVSCLADE